MQQFLKPACGAAWAGVVPAELLDQLLVAAHHAMAALHPRFGRVALPALTGDLETGAALVCCSSWHVSSSALEGGRAFFVTRRPQSTNFLLTEKKERNRIRAHLHMNTNLRPQHSEDADRETTIA
jgi:hypothetical protein